MVNKARGPALPKTAAGTLSSPVSPTSVLSPCPLYSTIHVWRLVTDLSHHLSGVARRQNSMLLDWCFWLLGGSPTLLAGSTRPGVCLSLPPALPSLCTSATTIQHPVAKTAQVRLGSPQCTVSQSRHLPSPSVWCSLLHSHFFPSQGVVSTTCPQYEAQSQCHLALQCPCSVPQFTSPTPTSSAQLVAHGYTHFLLSWPYATAVSFLVSVHSGPC